MNTVEGNEKAHLVQSLIITSDSAAIADAVELARHVSGRVTVVAVGDRDLAGQIAAGPVDEVVWVPVPEDAVPEALVQGVADLVAEVDPRILLAADGPASRVLAAAAAARIGAAVVTGLRQIDVDADGVDVICSAVGGRLERTLRVSGPLAVFLDGRQALSPTDGPTAPISMNQHSQVGGGARRTGVAVPADGHVSLASATRVVSVGRGLRDKADLALIFDLAAALGAEVACSLPMAEDQHWLDEERAIGISGQHVAPDLYVAVGISGQVQHMEGVRNAGCIVAINNSADAPINKLCDVAVLGDLYTIVPAFTEALRSDEVAG